MAEHTPTPWDIIAGDDYYITAEGYPKEFIGHFKGDENSDYLAIVGNRPKDFGEANAAFIVKAVNNHDALVEALKMARARIAVLGPFTASRHFDANEEVFLPKIDAVLAAVLPQPNADVGCAGHD